MKDRSRIVETVQGQLTIGSSRAQVERILGENDLEFSYVDRETLDSTTLDVDRPPATSGVKGRYLSVVRDVERRLFVSKSYSIEVDIDADDRVSAMRIRPVLTAP